MNKFLMLLSDELRRAKGFYIFLLAFAVVGELVALVLALVKQFQIDPMGLNNKVDIVTVLDQSMLTVLVIGGVVLAMVVYSIYTWLREWRLEGAYIYRLLSLPGSRMSVYMAKLFSILLMVAGLLLVQVLMLPLINLIGSFFPRIFRVIAWPQAWVHALNLVYLLVPVGITMGIYYYSAGINFLVSLFNLCIIIGSKKSHGWRKTLLLGGLYFMVFVLLQLAIVMTVVWMPLLQSESSCFFIVAQALMIALNLAGAKYLMNNYISI